MLREKLITAPILAMPQEEGQFTLDTDSSAEGLGAVLAKWQTSCDSLFLKSFKQS